MKDLNKGTRSAFFFPHQNESGYWWQGRTLASARLPRRRSSESRHVTGQLRNDLRAYAVDQLDWIFGLNPFDAACNSAKAATTPTTCWPNAPGGVCNRITSGFEDEHDIALMPAPQKDDPAQNWRWGNSGSRTAAGSCWRSPRRPH